MAVQIERMLFSTDQYEKMIEAGVLTENNRVELLRGEIVNMAPIGLRHSGCVARLVAIFSARLEQSAIVWPQNPIRLSDDSEPEPDVALLEPRADYYSSSRATPGDVLLLIEVADSTLARDKFLKLPLYAEGGITEYWIVNLVEDVVQTYSRPAKGSYSKVNQYQRGETLSPEAFPNLIIKVDEIIG